MKQLNQKPVIFLAFANDRVREGAYLRNLPEELRGIRNELDKAKNAGLCEIVERANATIDDILDVFQDKTYKNRIAVFHYGGHADSYKLLLEDFAGGPSSAYKKELACFFAMQKGLKLIFLNACSTIQHARELNNAGIPAVIGTLEKIEDNAALILATRFYNGLANGLPIERAWREAELEIEIKLGPSNTQALYQDGYAGDTDRFPWEILYKQGAEKVKEWNLPDAAHNPLFGLPAIPETYTLPEPPFLFLDRCTKKHAKIFFGRSYYIRALYDRVTDKNTAPIILLYGQSGVGKSSLLEAGLLPRLEKTHTCIYLRRIQEQGLSNTLIKSFCGGSRGAVFSKRAPLVA
ncbi:MAG: CHAT domain-containing protein, partial [Candidatus Aminicenantes bacterium]|nr:CHAT domain-containing protein [Candidatus Aminicenantes bacterium]NIM80702.1 CHAT domain-containing protein [Candidatus Aminicenantes bacterium]NIN20077.1 CHAT domain-containing protein [Candidatus Aminicenantes bacterium]NIN43864.1 CHAT domain-containing protein [Candidatus Aminicenantes bacterium]NIN86022.1 CHAT domain-containing protein [Candidatus Aminicenantes bacterium]